MSSFISHADLAKRTRTSQLKPFIMITLALAALLAFTGCGLSTSQGATTPSGTPTAQQILTSAQKAHLADEVFTVTMKSTSDGKPLNMTGSGKATENPERVSMSLTMELNGMTVTVEEVLDGATKTSYTRVTAPAQIASETWKKDTDTSGSSASSGLDLLVGSLYDKLSNTKLIGSEQVNGVDTWHIQGTSNDPTASDAEIVDIYIHQSDYLPAKMILHQAGTDPLDATLVYTSLNSGVSIDLPAA